jgi:tetratricopeptide (TPR) repeat protein
MTTVLVLYVIFHMMNVSAYAQDLNTDFNSDLYIEEGIRLYKNGDYGPAADKFQQAYILDSRNAKILYYIGKSYEKQNNINNAIYYYKKALNTEKELVAAWYNLGLLYARQNRFNEAINFFEMATRLDKKFAFAYYNLANVFLMQNKYQAAIDNYNSAINLNSDLAPAYFNLAYIYNKINQKEASLKYYEKYLALNPEDSEAQDIIKTLKQQIKGN